MIMVIKMSRKSVINIDGSKLKEFIIENQIDVESKCKISSREFARTTLTEVTDGNKIVSMGVLTYQNKKLKEYPPYPGEVISEELIYRYAIDNNIINPTELSYEDFTNNTQKIKNKVDESTLMRNVEMDIFGFTQNEMFTLERRKKTLILSVGEDRYNKLLEKNKKKLLKR